MARMRLISFSVGGKTRFKTAIVRIVADNKIETQRDGGATSLTMIKLQPPLEIMCDVLHAPDGRIVALDLHYDEPHPAAYRSVTRRLQLASLSAAQREEMFIHQLLSLESMSALLHRRQWLCSIALDFTLAQRVTESAFIRQIIHHLPFLRLSLSEDFPNLHDGTENPLIRALSEQLNILWLSDLGAGYANLNAVQSHIFEAVKLDRRFYVENVHKSVFIMLLRQVMQMTNRLIIDGVEDESQRLMLAQQGIWALQNYQYASLPLSKISSLPE